MRGSCNACGQAVVAAAVPAGTRKTVTILFCDVVDSTGLGDRLDAEALRAVMGRYFDVARPLIERHGGTVDKFIGDAVLGVFGVPRVHDDDALRAVRAADDLQQALADTGGMRVRIGVATGEAITGSGQTLGSGAVFNLAARLQTAASPGEVMISDATQRLVRDAVTVEALPGLALKGMSSPVRAYRLLGVTHDAPGHRRRLDASLVGRAREQRQIGDAFEQAVDGRVCHLVTLLGAAGVGKSRLANEFLTQQAANAVILRGRCLPYGDGITYYPLSEALADLPVADGAGEDVRARIEAVTHAEPDAGLIAEHLAGLAGSNRSGEVATREEVAWAARRLLETLARRRPVVLLLDDLQWAESVFLDLVDYIADWSRDAPIVLLCLARPELLEERPAWAGGKLNATTLLLERLAAPECESLVAQLVGPEVSRATCARVAEAAEGNPLFAEELVAMLADDGILKLCDGVYTEVHHVDDIAVPATVQAVLAARLDRLDRHERIALECAAVEGEIFHHSAVAELSSLDEDGDTLGTALSGLLRKNLVRPTRSSFPGEEAFRFHHLMVRDAAYDGLPKLVRAERHEQFAGWLERHRGHAGAGDEIVASHLTRALRYLEEVGVEGERRPDLAQRARAHLMTAGRRAMDRGDVGAATRLLSDAIVIADTATAERLPLLADLGFALLGSGALARAAEVFGEALGLARRLGERRLEQHALLGAALVRFQSDPSANTAAAQGTAAACDRGARTPCRRARTRPCLAADVRDARAPRGRGGNGGRPRARRRPCTPGRSSGSRDRRPRGTCVRASSRTDARIARARGDRGASHRGARRPQRRGYGCDPRRATACDARPR